MSPSKTLTRYLLRASLLQVALLLVWWGALLSPSLMLLRVTAEIPFRLLAGGQAIVVSDTGEWNFHIPVEATVPDSADPSRQVAIQSIDFALPPSDVVLFTFPLPVFWAVTLAASITRPNLIATLKGTGVILIVNVVLLLAFAEINAHRIVLKMYPAPDPFDLYLIELFHYLAVNVMPFAAPLIAAIVIHPVLRAAIFPTRNTV